MKKVTRTKKSSGITLIEMCIVLLLLTVLMAIALPSVMRARSNAQIKACRSHLTHIQDAKQRWAMEDRKEGNSAPTREELIPSYLKDWPECPAGGEYSIETVDKAPTCSIGEEHGIP